MSATLGTLLLTWLRGEFVGADGYGNRYYRLKGDKPTRRGGGRFSRERRWVIYDGEPEGSKVPPEWHAWLHHMVDEVPQPRQRHRLGEGPPAEHDRNAEAYHPPGSVLRGGHRAPRHRRLRAVVAGIARAADTGRRDRGR